MEKQPWNPPDLAASDPRPIPATRPLRIASYHRASTLDQHPDLARTELRAHAQRLGGQLVMEIEEHGSGARSDRPGLQQIMEAARRGRIDCLLVWKLDRLSRSVIDLHTTAQALDSYGTRLACVTQDIDTGSSSGRLLFSVLAAASAYERDVLIERTRSGLARARRAGKKLGRPKHTHITVEAVVKLRETGASWRSIANTLGATTGLVRLRFTEHESKRARRSAASTTGSVGGAPSLKAGVTRGRG